MLPHFVYFCTSVADAMDLLKKNTEGGDGAKCGTLYLCHPTPLSTVDAKQMEGQTLYVK